MGVHSFKVFFFARHGGSKQQMVGGFTWKVRRYDGEMPWTTQNHNRSGDWTSNKLVQKTEKNTVQVQTTWSLVPKSLLHEVCCEKTALLGWLNPSFWCFLFHFCLKPEFLLAICRIFHDFHDFHGSSPNSYGNSDASSVSIPISRCFPWLFDRSAGFPQARHGHV